MKPYEKHVFVCENRRDENSLTGCCASKGAQDITNKLKKLCGEAGLNGKVRINKSGCLGQCAKGPALVIYPEGSWHFNVTLDDADNLFSQHINNKPLA